MLLIHAHITNRAAEIVGAAAPARRALHLASAVWAIGLTLHCCWAALKVLLTIVVLCTGPSFRDLAMGKIHHVLVLVHSALVEVGLHFFEF